MNVAIYTLPPDIFKLCRKWIYTKKYHHFSDLGAPLILANHSWRACKLLLQSTTTTSTSIKPTH